MLVNYPYVIQMGWFSSCWINTYAEDEQAFRLDPVIAVCFNDVDSPSVSGCLPPSESCTR